MKTMAYAILILTTALANAAQTASADPFVERFEASTRTSQTVAALDRSKSSIIELDEPLLKRHPLDEVIERRSADLRAFLHDGGSFEDLVFVWTTPAATWPVLSAQFEEQEQPAPAMSAATKLP
ncbi:MAG: hypothetical protein Athens041674_513 [Parcubacteria group bacterium Athens0416_74]|nr:MAG: hypothetical protein Athens041674_513 [Parcubacteria group bacterium Athens0416_74]